MRALASSLLPVLVVLGAYAQDASDSSEPTYAGRSLGAWSTRALHGVEDQRREAIAALSSWLTVADPPLAKRVASPLYKASQSRGVALLPMETLARALARPEPDVRNYAAQIALRALARERRLDVPTLCALLADPERQIGLYRIGGRGWDDFLGEQLRDEHLGAGDVAAVASLATHPDPRYGAPVRRLIADRPDLLARTLPALPEAQRLAAVAAAREERPLAAVLRAAVERLAASDPSPAVREAARALTAD